MPRHQIGKPDLSDYAWLVPPITEWYDPTGGLPVDPDVGDRYGADATAEGWTIDYIYEWDGTEWVESEPEEGWMIWALSELLFYVFFSGGWMEIGADSFLKLDQTTPQTISNGIPVYASDHAAFTEAHQLIDKEYVDDISIGTYFDFYAYDDASDVATYKEFKLTPSPDVEVEDTVEILGNATAQLVGVRITEDTIDIPDIMTVISSGIFTFHVHLKAATASRLKFYAELYVRDDEDAETLVCTTIETDFVGTTSAGYNSHGSIPVSVPLTAGDRLVVKGYATNASPAATNLYIAVEGDTATRVNLAGITSPLDHGSTIGREDDDHTQYARVSQVTDPQTIGLTGSRLTKLWATDIESTNIPTVGGTALDATFLTLDQNTTPQTITGGIRVDLGNNQIARLNDNSSASAIWGTNIGFLSEDGAAKICSNSSTPIRFYTGGTRNTMGQGTLRAEISTSGNLAIQGPSLTINNAGATNSYLNIKGYGIITGEDGKWMKFDTPGSTLYLNNTSYGQPVQVGRSTRSTPLNVYGNILCSLNLTDGAKSISIADIKDGIDSIVTIHSGLTGLDADDHTQYIHTTPTTSARNVIQPSAADKIPFTLKGFASQSANLLQISDSAGNDYFVVDNAGNTFLTGNQYLSFRDSAIGAYSQADSFLDFYADGAVRIGDSGAGAPTNYSKFEPDGTLEFNGDSIVWKDINMGSAMLSRPASSQPGTDEFVDENGADTGIETYAFAVDEKVSGSFEMQHDYKEGSDFTFHVHWQGITAPSGTDNVQWRLIYTISRDNETIDAVTTVDSADTPIAVQYDSLRTDVVVIDGSTKGVGGTPVKIGDQFLFQLLRVASTGDAYLGDALLETAGIHYQVNTVGSRQIITK